MNDDPNQVKYNPEKPESQNSGPHIEPAFDPTIAGILNNGFSIGGSNFLQIIAISLLPLAAGVPLAVSVIVTVLAGSGENTPVFIAGVAISFVLLVAFLYLSLWSQAALIKGLVKLIRSQEAKLDLKEALRLGRDSIWTYVVAIIALGLLTMAGFILLIIPGLIAMVLFYFVPYVALEEEKSVKETFRRARTIMEGNVGTFLLILLIIFAVVSASAWVPFLSIIFIPFEAAIFAYMYVAFSENNSKRMPNNA